ncbi:hypothetical protein ACLBXM_18585 [Xanthobacteraceae bacterium A53D]
MAGSSEAGKSKQTHEVTGIIAQVTDLIGKDAYRETAAAIADFHKAHPGLLFYVQEALPFRVSDRVLEKTGAHVAFTTYTLRHPNWATEINNAATNPEAFEKLVTALEAELAAKKKAA